MEPQSTPPSGWRDLPFYMKVHFIVASLAILWRGFTFVVSTNRKVTQSRLACQEKSATFFSNVLVPILKEREAAQIPQGQQIVASTMIWLEMSIGRCKSNTSFALAVLNDELFRTSTTRGTISHAEQGGVIMHLHAAAAIDRFFPPAPNPQDPAAG